MQPEARLSARPDRILYSKAFRRLKHKTRSSGPHGDHYRTRLTHTGGLPDRPHPGPGTPAHEDYEAISLGHDLGHTPFGHAGESVLDELLPGGFRHNEQSLRVVDQLEKNGEGLNLTYEVRMGILGHAKGRGAFLLRGDPPEGLTLEAQLVRVADVMAYIAHDTDDALRGGVIAPRELPGGWSGSWAGA